LLTCQILLVEGLEFTTYSSFSSTFTTKSILYSLCMYRVGYYMWVFHIKRIIIDTKTQHMVHKF